MLLSHVHHDSEYLFLPSHKSGPYSLFDIKNIAEKYSLSLVALRFHCGISELKEDKNPFITVINRMHTKHSLIVKKVTKKYVYFIDPESGEGKMKVESFNMIWSGDVLKINHFHKMKCPIKSVEILDFKKRLVLSLVEAVSGASLICGTLLINKSIPLFIPIIFFALCLLLEILKKISLIKIMKEIDKKMLSSFTSKRSEDYYQYYVAYNELKKCSFIFPMNIILSLMSLSLVIAVIIFNGYANLIYVIVPLLIAFIEAVLIEPKLASDNRHASFYEEEIKKACSFEEFYPNTLKAGKYGYHAAKISTIFYYLSGGVMILSILLIMAINSTISLPYVIFYFSICLFIKQNLSNIFKSLTDKDNFNVNKVRLINLINRQEK